MWKQSARGKSKREQGELRGPCGAAVVLRACPWGHQGTLGQLNTLGLHQWLNCFPSPLDQKKKMGRTSELSWARVREPQTKKRINHISLFVYENKVLSKTKERGTFQDRQIWFGVVWILFPTRIHNIVDRVIAALFKTCLSSKEANERLLLFNLIWCWME